MKIILSALFVVSSLLIVSAPANAWVHHQHAWRHGHHARGETCWRTNRHTGAHFRIC